MPNFNDAGVAAIFNAVVSAALTSGRFDSVNSAEPLSAPGNGITAALWTQNIRPIGRASGLSATSGALDFMLRIYTSFIQQPRDAIDPNVMSATVAMMGIFCGGFSLDTIPAAVVDVRAIDVFGMYGTPLRSQAGYVEIERKIYRIMDITLPIIVNDLFILAP